ncbi:hypothetical protein ZHAS_00006921 [Anopheles sinensis]|uniref:Uncharacterized protein n=1 Tax=Anopheles sinensis TaxID=74873 RepID=A0A084VN88_ANOSI|nr:hypothetical protein ZHAS_00006921 [Anopheles sinensis]
MVRTLTPFNRQRNECSDGSLLFSLAKEVAARLRKCLHLCTGPDVSMDVIGNGHDGDHCLLRAGGSCVALFYAAVISTFSASSGSVHPTILYQCVSLRILTNNSRCHL